MLNDPKYTPTNEGIYHSDGYLIPSSEPMMMLRGKDIGAIVCILSYLEMLEEQPQNKVIISHKISAIERLSAFLKYQLENEDLQSVGCSRRSHSHTGWILTKAKRYLDNNLYTDPP